MIKTPEQVAESVAYIQRHRSASAPFDVALTGCSTPTGNTLVRDFAAAEVTWWLESLHGFRGAFDELQAQVIAGPPV